MILVKKHIGGNNRKVFVFCDSGVLGRVFEEGKKVLDLIADFYKGEKFYGKSLSEACAGADMLFLVGKETLEKAKKEGIVDAKGVLSISGVPYAQVILV